MSEEDKAKQERTRRVPEKEHPEADAAGSPGPGPMGTGDPEAGDSGPMGTKGARLNEDAASHDKAGERGEREA